jgi:hypothetical protein
MFNLENILRTIAVLAGVLIISSYYFDFSYLVARLLSKKKTAPTETVDNNDQFLQIIDLWYKLRGQCVEAKLDLAIQKLDEVFPLLNNKVEEKNV